MYEGLGIEPGPEPAFNKHLLSSCKWKIYIMFKLDSLLKFYTVVDGPSPYPKNW